MNHLRAQWREAAERKLYENLPPKEEAEALVRRRIDKILFPGHIQRLHITEDGDYGEDRFGGGPLKDRFELRKVVRTVEANYPGSGNFYDTTYWGVFVDGEMVGYVDYRQSGQMRFISGGSVGKPWSDFRISGSCSRSR